MTQQAIQYTKEQLHFAESFIDSVVNQENAVQGIAESIRDKSGKVRKLTDAKWQTYFQPFQDRAQLRTGASLEDAIDGRVRTMKSRVKGLLQTDYDFTIEPPVKSETAEAKKRRENREKEQKALQPLAEQVARHAEANDLSLTVAAAELADRKKDNKESAKIIKAGKLAEKQHNDARAERIKEARDTISGFMKTATIKDASDAEADVLQQMAALITKHRADVKAQNDGDDIPA